VSFLGTVGLWSSPVSSRWPNECWAFAESQRNSISPCDFTHHSGIVISGVLPTTVWYLIEKNIETTTGGVPKVSHGASCEKALKASYNSMRATPEISPDSSSPFLKERLFFPMIENGREISSPMERG
jgi:hypothetical protein